MLVPGRLGQTSRYRPREGSLSLATELALIGQLQARLPGPVVLLVALVSLGAAVLPDVWLVSRHVTVMAHEGAHATMGSALGRRVNGVRIRRNAEGATDLSSGGPAGSIAVGVVGYFGPSVFGIGAAELISARHIIAVLWAALAALVLLMIPLRRSFGVVTVVLAAVLLFTFVAVTAVGGQVLVAYGIAWFLLLSGVRRNASIIGQMAADAAILRGLTRIPHTFWPWVWLLGSLAAVGYGATLLI